MCDSDSLSQFYPLEEALGFLKWSHSGWDLSLRHRHYSGSYSDCSLEHYERLTTGELCDVIDAVANSLGVLETELIEWKPQYLPPAGESPD